MVSRVLAERERVEILESIEAMEGALQFLRAKTKSHDPEERQRARDQAERIQRLLELAKLGRDLLNALVEKARVDASPLVKFLLGSTGPKGASTRGR
jgi:hypothetical protein